MSGSPSSRAAQLAALLGASGCSIPLAELYQTPVNTCDSSLDCGAGATCADVGTRRACVTTSADLGGLIVEIRPGAASDLGAEISYLIDVAALGIELPEQVPGGHVHAFDPKVPPPARVEATVDLGGSYCDGRVSGELFPVRVEFRRVPPYLGLPGQSYSITSELDDSATLQTFELAIPTGDYHVYLIPQPYGDCVDDVPPPIFLPNQHVPEVWTRPISAEAPQILQGQLQLPQPSSDGQSVSVDGWRLDLVDSLMGNPISQVDTLEQDGAASEVDFNVKFYWPDVKAYKPLIRLRPKEGEPRPTMYWDVASIALQGSTDNVRLSLSQVDAIARHVEGRALDAEGNPVFAAVRIQSAEIAGEVTTAAYKLETETDAQGVFSADLPPGEYDVFAQPINDPSKASAQSILKFTAGDDCYCGQSISIPDTGTLRGSVRGPAGESMDGAAVFAVPSIVDVTAYLDRVLGPDPLLPRRASTTVFGGEFSFRTDPGEFDLSVRPSAGSAYPWLLIPRLKVPADSATTDRGELAVPYPAVLQGVVRDDSGAPLRDALVVAWLPVEGSSARGAVAGVLQIGETSSGADGSYVLPLPPAVAR